MRPDIHLRRNCEDNWPLSEAWPVIPWPVVPAPTPKLTCQCMFLLWFIKLNASTTPKFISRRWSSLTQMMISEWTPPPGHNTLLYSLTSVKGSYKVVPCTHGVTDHSLWYPVREWSSAWEGPRPAVPVNVLRGLVCQRSPNIQTRSTWHRQQFHERWLTSWWPQGEICQTRVVLSKNLTKSFQMQLIEQQAFYH